MFSNAKSQLNKMVRTPHLLRSTRMQLRGNNSWRVKRDAIFRKCEEEDQWNGELPPDESFIVVAVTICLIVSYDPNSSLYKCYNFLEGAEMSGTSMHSSSVSIYCISLSRYWGAYKKFNVSRRVGMVRHIRFET